jgi:hypothetical protein
LGSVLLDVSDRLRPLTARPLLLLTRFSNLRPGRLPFPSEIGVQVSDQVAARTGVRDDRDLSALHGGSERIDAETYVLRSAISRKPRDVKARSYTATHRSGRPFHELGKRLVGR